MLGMPVRIGPKLKALVVDAKVAGIPVAEGGVLEKAGLSLRLEAFVGRIL